MAYKQIIRKSEVEGETILGDADKVQELLKRKDAEAADRYKQQEEELEELRNQREVNDNADTE